jgi:hypothetical protein
MYDDFFDLTTSRGNGHHCVESGRALPLAETLDPHRVLPREIIAPNPCLSLVARFVFVDVARVRDPSGLSESDPT